ncbi:MAG: hypothetical protein WAN65_20845, partial [Candidatus Sulfotelmatobacter sp.]
MAIWTLNPEDLIRGATQKGSSLERAQKLEQELLETRQMLMEAIRHNEGLLALRDKSHQRAVEYVIEISELKTQILEGRALEIRLNQVIRARDREIGGLRLEIAA